MIVQLKGILEAKTPTSAVIDCGGVGYEVLIALSTFDHLPSLGAAVKVFTEHVVREDSQLLFGFATEKERDMFRLITSISGVGPKTALGILSGLTVGDLQLAISQGDSKRLASVKGVGKKTAERMVVELRDKINPIEALANGTAEKAGDAKASVVRDAMLALTALGFAEDVARKQVEAVLANNPAIPDTETIVRLALSGKGGKK